MCKSNFTFKTVLICIAIFAAVSQAQYSNGDGTRENPYKIRTPSDWLTLINRSGDWNKHFILTADLDLKDITLSPVGTNSKRFTGVLDGNGHIMRNLVIEQSNSYVGLFGYLGQNGHISNIHLENVRIAGQSYVGGLVAQNSNGSLSACSITGGEVKGTGSFVGGLVGRNDQGDLSNCSAMGSVSGSLSTYYSYDYAGGLVGYNSGGNLIACSAEGPVSGRGHVGGLCGDVNDCNMINCHARGLVSGGYNIGGLVGSNSGGSLTACSAAGPVQGTGSCVGGLVGRNDHGDLTTCSATGSVSGSLSTYYSYDYAGGLVGYNSGGNLIACSADGSVSGRGNVGGLVGHNSDGIVNDCHASGLVSGGYYVGGLVGDNANASLTACSATGLVQGIGSHVGGLVGSNDQANITTCSATGAVSGSLSTYYSYDYAGGLVGYNSGGNLIACSAEGPVSGRRRVGGLVGKNSVVDINDCNVIDCYARGSVKGNSYVGGLIGDNNDCLSACYSVGRVTGTGAYVGGLVGYDPDPNRHMLKSCFWDFQASGLITSAVGIPRTTEEMKRRSTFINAGWDFLDETENGIAETWTILGVDYPRLCWQVYYRIAYAPNPAEGTGDVDPNVTLSWIPSITAARHDLYFGDNFDDVNDGLVYTLRGSPTEPNFTVVGLVPDANYYWRVDEVNDADPASPWKGQVWSFTVPQKKAHNPYPPDGATEVDPNVVLMWTPGYGAQKHTVYFGQDFNDVNNATGGIPQEPNTYIPGTLGSGKTYCWRVDEVNDADPASPRKGVVWSFTVKEWIRICQVLVSSGKDDGYAFNESPPNMDTPCLRVGASKYAEPPYYMACTLFRDVCVPQDVRIVSACLKICSCDTQLTDDVYAIIQAEDTDNAAPPDKPPHIADRPKTDASVDWDHVEPWSPDTWYESPDIAAVIQEVIRRDGWSAGNSLAIFYSTREHKGGYRQFSSYDRGADFAPVLEITYEP